MVLQRKQKYHSVISVHINFNDAYDNAPSFNDFVKANALIRKETENPILLKITMAENVIKPATKAIGNPDF